MALLFADATADALGGASGWVGAGLLGLVLAWLFGKHLPDKDRQLSDKDRLLREMLEAKDAALKAAMEDKDRQIALLLDHKWQAIMALSADHKEAVKALAAEFRAVTVELSRHCDQEIDRLVKLIESRLPTPATPRQAPGGVTQ